MYDCIAFVNHLTLCPLTHYLHSLPPPHTHMHTHTSQDSSPTETIPLSDLNVTMNGQTGHPNGMQITAVIRGKTRNYYVYAEIGKVGHTAGKYLIALPFHFISHKIFQVTVDLEHFML